MDYRVAFDVAQSGYQGWHAPVRVLWAVGFGVVLAALRTTLAARLPRYATAYGIVAFGFLGLACLWLVISLFSTYIEYTGLVDAQETGQALVVEGVVTDFTTVAGVGGARERFCVRKMCFEYSDDVDTSAYHATSLHGGSVRLGLPVRVTYVRGAIVRLEVAD